MLKVFVVKFSIRYRKTWNIMKIFFRFEQCNKICQSCRLLSYHIRDVYIDKVRCDYCDKPFSELSDIKKKHKKDKSTTGNVTIVTRPSQTHPI